MASRPALLRFGSLVVAVSLLFGGTARGQEGAVKDAALEDARAHVGKAKVHYDLGEYEQAAEEYTLVYRIKALPALLFNIAQAYRQAGKYEKAKQFYKSFLRESPDQKSKPSIEKAIKEIDELLAKDKRAREVPPTGTAEAAQLAPPVQESSKAPSVAARPAQTASAQVAPAAMPLSPSPSAPATASSTSGNARPATSRLSTEQARPVSVAVKPQPAESSAAPPEITQRASVPAAWGRAEASTPLYKKWWLWTAVGVVAVGAGAAAVTMGGNVAPGSHFGTSKVFP